MLRLVRIIIVSSYLIRFRAFHNITILLKEVSLISDNKGEYFWLKILIDSSLISLENFIILKTIILKDANVAIAKIIEKYPDI